jgi:hypothetical protein
MTLVLIPFTDIWIGGNNGQELSRWERLPELLARVRRSETNCVGRQLLAGFRRVLWGHTRAVQMGDGETVSSLQNRRAAIDDQVQE